MVDASDEGLLNNNAILRKNTYLSIDSISEKQEESSNSSIKNSKIMKTKIPFKNNNSKGFIVSTEVSKDGIDTNTNNVSSSNVASEKLKYKKAMSIKKRKTVKVTNERLDDNVDTELKPNESPSKKRSQILLSAQRTSFQNDNLHFLNQIKNYDDIKNKRSTTKNLENNMTTINKTMLKEKKSLNLTGNFSKLDSEIYAKNSIIGQTLLKNNLNMSNSDFLDMKYFSKKKLKHTVLKKGKLDIRDTKAHSSNLFDKLRESDLFEKSEILLFKLKICYCVLSLFSFMSILLEIIDSILYNNRTEEFLFSE